MSGKFCFSFLVLAEMVEGSVMYAGNVDSFINEGYNFVPSEVLHSGNGKIKVNFK